MPKGLQSKGIARRNRMLHAAIRLFLQNGYEKTTTSSIAKEAGMAPSSFFAAFASKEALLLILVKLMFAGQFESAEQIQGQSDDDPVMLYVVETSLQMYITELSEPLRDLYVTGYSLPSTSEYIYSSTAKRLPQIFGKYMPDAQEKDFYEMDIGSSGMMRAYMARPCDFYFTIEDKISRFLENSLTLYGVPLEKQRQVIRKVLEMNLGPAAEKIITGMAQKAEEGIDLIGDE